MIYSKITSLALAFLLVLQITAAQPYRKRQHRRSPKAEAIPEPEPVAEALPVETVIVYVTVDQFGNRIGEPRTVAPEHTPAPAPTPDPSPVTATPESTQKASPDLDTSYGTSKGVASVSGKAIVYSPYRADRNCKSESEVAADIAQIQDFSLIRLYGIDCNQVQYVRASIKKPSTKLFIGIYDIERYEEQVQTLISIMGGDWSDVHTVAIGNEVVNSGRMSAGAVVERVNKARTILRGAGYNGPVVTVDTWVAIMANPSLCEASDYIAANCHPYFDGNVPASGAGDFLVVQGNNVKKTCPGKDLLITETGWPHSGNSNGQAHASDADQHTALTSMWKAVGSGAIYFTYEDDLWKVNNAATHNAETAWGIKNRASVFS